MAADTGHGATIAFTGFTAAPTSFVVTPNTMNLGEMVREALKTSTLATTLFHTYKPGDLVEPPDLEVTHFFDTLLAEQSFSSGADTFALIHDPIPGTCTITLPEQNAAGNPPSFAGTGFLMSATLPELVTDQLMVSTFLFKFDGETGPTWTEDATS